MHINYADINVRLLNVFVMAYKQPQKYWGRLPSRHLLCLCFGGHCCYL